MVFNTDWKTNTFEKHLRSAETCRSGGGENNSDGAGEQIKQHSSMDFSNQRTTKSVDGGEVAERK